MDANKIVKIIINKNRGWRGLAELTCLDGAGKTVHKMIFSFSQAVWNDMLNGSIVIQDEDNFYILNFFDSFHELPRKDQQRSVLIKNLTATVIDVSTYPKGTLKAMPLDACQKIDNFKKNRNNHTTSDWNCIGVRVTPII